MIREMTREQWESMTPAEVASLITRVMPQGAEEPLPEACLRREDDI
jgi:hypothetical protein